MTPNSPPRLIHLCPVASLPDPVLTQFGAQHLTKSITMSWETNNNWGGGGDAGGGSSWDNGATATTDSAWGNGGVTAAGNVEDSGAGGFAGDFAGGDARGDANGGGCFNCGEEGYVRIPPSVDLC